jgi:hypothetical protein
MQKNDKKRLKKVWFFASVKNNLNLGKIIDVIYGFNAWN